MSAFFVGLYLQNFLIYVQQTQLTRSVLKSPSACFGIAGESQNACKDDEVREIEDERVPADKGDGRVPLAVDFFEKRATGRVDERSYHCAEEKEGGIWDYAEQIARGQFALIVERRRVAVYVFGREEYAENLVCVFRRRIAKI